MMKHTDDFKREAMRRFSGVLSTYREDQYAAVTLTAGVEGRHAQG